jgi:hypothetical protein
MRLPSGSEQEINDNHAIQVDEEDGTTYLFMKHDYITFTPKEALIILEYFERKKILLVEKSQKTFEILLITDYPDMVVDILRNHCLVSEDIDVSITSNHVLFYLTENELKVSDELIHWLKTADQCFLLRKYMIDDNWEEKI